MRTREIGIALAFGIVVLEQASSQEAQPSAAENVVITAEERQDTFQKQVTADRTAAEARRLFGQLREGGGDRALACRTAAQAGRDYADAITEARQLAKDAAPPLQQRLEVRIKGMTERRGNLDDIQDRLCKDGGIARGTGQRDGQPPRRRPQ